MNTNVGRKLKVDLVCPRTGELLIYAFRTITKKHLIKAMECGAEITPEMLYVPRELDAHERAAARKRERRIAWLEFRIERYTGELAELRSSASAQRQSEPRR